MVGIGRKHAIRASFATLLLLAPATGCGSGVEIDRSVPATRVAGPGISIEVPSGWSARILVGSAARPVLHVANYPLPPNDDDEGSVAQQMIGSEGQVYLNVRDLGPSDVSPTRVRFQASDFGTPLGPGGRCCFVTAASAETGTAGSSYRVTAVSGSNARPHEEVVDEVNRVLATLELEPFAAPRIAPAEGSAFVERGVGLTVPTGWESLPSERGVRLAADGLSLELQEAGGSDAPFVPARMPIVLSPTEFVPDPDSARGFLTQRSLLVSGRQFILSARSRSRHVDSERLAEANAALASLAVEPGDFYPGVLTPPVFGQADGWHTGTSAPAPIEPGGESTTAWAATVPYQDPPRHFPPLRTLTTLPTDGIILLVWLDDRPGGASEGNPEPPRLDLGDAVSGPFEGVPAEQATYQLRVSRGGFGLTAWVFFGGVDPDDAQIARAQRELDRLDMPAWPS